MHSDPSAPTLSLSCPSIHRTAPRLLPGALAAITFLVLLGPTFELMAQTDEARETAVTVGTRVVAPFVIQEEDGSFHGMTVALWEHVAGELGLEYRFEERDIAGMLDGVADGSLYASASALTITSQREEEVDFTHPFYVTGLGIAVPREPAGLGSAILALFDPEFLWVVFLLAGVLLFWGFLVWVFERAENQEEFGGTPVQGIGSGFWWAAVTMTTVGYGDKSPQSVGGRIVGFVWMFTAIIVISFFTASITSSLTVSQIDGRVAGAEDLPHVRVGALAESAAEIHLREEFIQPRGFETLEEGLAAVAEGDVDAFVHDAPILRFLAQEGRSETVRVLPGTFAEQYYGIALPLDLPDRNRINQILLDYLVSPEWEQVRRRYMGAS
jgi:polar amino acid transport system substrate-binding protein